MTRPPNTVATLEVVGLWPICVELTSQHKTRELAPARWWLRVGSSDTEQIAEEDAWMSSLSKQEQSISMWCERMADWRVHVLALLCVMDSNECL